MEFKSRKITHKRKRNNRKKLGTGILVAIGLLLLFTIYQQQQTIKVNKPVVKPVIVKEEATIQQAEPKVPKQEKVDNKPVVSVKEDKGVVIEVQQRKEERPVTTPIVKENIQKKKPAPPESVTTTGEVNILHKVKSKETLYSIAQIYYSDKSVERIMSANQITNPSLDVKVGSTLKIPNPSYLGVHTVQKGETLFQVGRTYYNKSAIVEYMSQVNHISSGVKEGASVTVFNQGGLTTHTVKRKETLFGIMNQYYHLSELLKLIQNVNHVGEGVKEGQQLLIPNPFFIKSKKVAINWSIEILVNNHSLVINRDGKLYKKYSVATGKGTLTPKGTFKIVTKFKNPEYTPKRIPGGDPQNPLGTRWLGIDVPGTTGRTYGIHGTSDPSSIGKNVSNGCVRLKNADVEEIFEIIPIGTEVIIK